MPHTNIAPSVITREFEASRQRVFDAWTQVNHLEKWMFPMPGCTCAFASADIRSGGKSLHKISMPNGYEMWLLTHYEDVSGPDKLVFLQYISDKDGNVVPNPQMPNWPKDMLATLYFEELGPNKTKLTFSWASRDPTPEEIETFEASRAEHPKGWGAGMDQLERYLSINV